MVKNGKICLRLEDVNLRKEGIYLRITFAPDSNKSDLIRINGRRKWIFGGFNSDSSIWHLQGLPAVGQVYF